ncbi:MAG: hypothetical protein MUD01_04840 [Chloroflexaceae bacterium]|jgi:hypothetical protein|nr:hypothetical protein [Chloroflexaceae bacterium]
MKHSLYIITVSLLLLTLSSCGPVATRPTPTAAVLPTAEPTAVPTIVALPAATLVPLAKVPAMQQARDLIEANNPDDAIRLLTPLLGSRPNEPELRNLLAIAYLNQGRRLLTASDALPQLGLALDAFTSGLAVAPADGPVRAELDREVNQAWALTRMVQQLRTFAALPAGTPLSDAQREQLNGLLTELEELASQPQAFPGLPALRVQALLLAATTAREANNNEQVRDYCQQAVALDGENQQARRCLAEAEAALAPTPTPVPTTVAQAPARLRVQRLNQNDEPGCISLQVRGISTGGWRLGIDGLRLSGAFDTGGNVRICGLGNRQEVTVTVFNRVGNVVPGGAGVPARGGDILVANWR